MKFYYNDSGDRRRFYLEMDNPKPDTKENNGTKPLELGYWIIKILSILCHYFYQ